MRSSTTDNALRAVLGSVTPGSVLAKPHRKMAEAGFAAD
jgi:hypothetical protein